MALTFLTKQDTYVTNASNDPLTSFLHRHPNTLLWLVYLVIAIMYCYLTQLSSRNIFAPTPGNYYIYQLDAFVHGRINVTPPNTYDLSLYHSKWYLYWGSAPILFLWPFYLLWGTNASDVLYTMLGGLANVLLMYFCVREVKRYFNLSLSPLAELFLILGYAFASPNFTLSLEGKIAFTSQIFATTYLLLFLFFFFKYLNTAKQYQIMLAVTFFCLACLSRYSLIFNGLLLTYLLCDRKLTGKKISPRLLLSIGSLLVFFLLLGALLNYMKFQNIFEVGLRFVQGAPRYTAIEHSGKIFSLGYLWHNIYYGFLNPVSLSWQPLAIKVDSEGNSAFLFYPSLLLCPLLFFKYKHFDTKKRFFVLITGAAIVITVVSLLLYFSDGWAQFGYRYLLDAFPLYFLLLSLVLPYLSENVLWTILIWGTSINFLAIMA